MHPERRPDTGAPEPESEIRLSKRSADFASNETASDVQEIGLTEREPLTMKSLNAELEQIWMEMRNPNLTPQERSNLTRRQKKLRSARKALLAQTEGAEIDNDATRRTDDMEAVFGATIDEAAHDDQIAPPPSSGEMMIPGATAVSEKHGRILSEHLRDAESKRGDVERVERIEAAAIKDAKAVNELRAQFHKLEADIASLQKQDVAAKKFVATLGTIFEGNLNAAKDLGARKGTDMGGDPLKFFLKGELPTTGFFRKRVDLPFAVMREKLNRSLQDFARLSAEYRGKGFDVAAPEEEDLRTAGLPPAAEVADPVELHLKQLYAEREAVLKEHDEVNRKFLS